MRCTRKVDWQLWCLRMSLLASSAAYPSILCDRLRNSGDASGVCRQRLVASEGQEDRIRLKFKVRRKRCSTGKKFGPSAKAKFLSSEKIHFRVPLRELVLFAFFQSTCNPNGHLVAILSLATNFINCDPSSQSQRQTRQFKRQPASLSPRPTTIYV